MCQEVVELVTDYLEGTMSAPHRARFEAHLANCPHCTRYLEQMRRTLDILGRIEPEDVAPEAMEELMALYHRWQAE